MWNRTHRWLDRALSLLLLGWLCPQSALADTATKLPRHRLTVTRSGAGAVVADEGGLSCGKQCTAQYEKNTHVHLQAIPETEHAFVGWTQACAGQGTGACMVSLHKSAQVGAIFLPLSCHESGFCWENPYPQGNHLRGVVQRGGEPWAVGEAGTLLRQQNLAWRRLPLDLRGDLHGITTFGGALWAVGEAGVALQVSASPTRVATDTQAALHAAVAAAGKLWLLGEGGAVLRLAAGGLSFSRVQSGTDAALRAGVGLKDGSVLAVGDGGVALLIGSAGTTAWESGTKADLLATAAQGQDLKDLWIAGKAGTLLRGRGGPPFQPIVTGTRADLTSLTVSGKDLWVGGAQGTLLRWDGKALQPVRSAAQEDILALTPLPGGGILAVGKEGMVQRVQERGGKALVEGESDWLWGVSAHDSEDDASPAAKPDPAKAKGKTKDPGAPQRSQRSQRSQRFGRLRGGLNGVFAAGAGSLWAVGEAGLIMRYSGSAWFAVPSGTTESLQAVWAWGDTALAVGASGTVLRWDGTAWAALASPSRSSLWAVHGTRGDDVWLVGNFGTVLRWDGRSLQEVKSGVVRALHAVWSAGREAWIAGGKGTLLRFDGARLRAVPSSTEAQLLGLAGTAADDLWAVGEGGTVLHYDGARVVAVASGTRAQLNGVAVLGRQQAYAVGADGTLLHVSVGARGPGSSPVALGTRRGLFAVTTFGGKDAWVVGQGGAILHQTDVPTHLTPAAGASSPQTSVQVPSIGPTVLTPTPTAAVLTGAPIPLEEPPAQPPPK